METFNEINVVFMPVTQHAFLQPVVQGVISTFKPYYVRNAFHKVIPSIDTDPMMDLGKVS